MPPLEIVVIDDGSTDDSVEVVERFAQSHPIVRLLRNERNLGVVATLNRGVKEARGELWFGCSADDVVEPCLIESVQSLSRRHPQAGIYFGMYRGVDRDGEELFIVRPTRWHEETYAPPERFLGDYLEAEHCVHSPSPATIYRRRYLEEHGGFRSELGHWCDTFLIRSIGLKYGAAYTPNVLMSWRQLPESFSKSQARNTRMMLDIVARAAWLMRSPEFRDRFPEAHVARWEKAYRDHVIWTAHQSQMRVRFGPQPESAGDAGRGGRSVPWPSRLWSRIVLSYHWRRMQAYTPDLSCYSAALR
jgi:glycosyltransferase involved in cell wall biosynthesis